MLELPKETNLTYRLDAWYEGMKHPEFLGHSEFDNYDLFTQVLASCLKYPYVRVVPSVKVKSNHVYGIDVFVRADAPIPFLGYQTTSLEDFLDAEHHAKACWGGERYRLVAYELNKAA